MGEDDAPEARRLAFALPSWLRPFPLDSGVRPTWALGVESGIHFMTKSGALAKSPADGPSHGFF